MKRSALILAAVALIATLALAGSRELANEFQNPPDSARPWVYWFWSDGNISREGIKADLEAMHRAGIRGMIIMEVDQGIPKGPARFLSPKWRELFQYASQEAERLGIEIDMNNDGGWCGSGGPWITPELSMQVVVWSETHVKGSRRFNGLLAQPKITRDYYRDIAVVAFKSVPGVRMAEASPRITYGKARQEFDAAKLMDGNPGTVVPVPPPAAGEPLYLNVEFPKPFMARSLSIAIDRYGSWTTGNLEISDDGAQFRTVHAVTADWPVAVTNFDPVTARYYRLAVKIDPARYPKGVPISEIELHGENRIEEISGKAAYAGPYPGPVPVSPAMPGPRLAASMAIASKGTLDLTAKMDRSGRLTWDVPEGNWTVLRFGHTSSGKTNHPAPEESIGLECDKFSKEAVEVQFKGLLGKLVEDQKAIGGKALTYAHIDSWEVRSQNWGRTFREEFRKRRGYDPLPWLPAMTSRIEDSTEATERFLWDIRRTVADLIVEQYAAHMAALSRQHGLKLSIEAYGDGPLDFVPYAGRADMPMAEFWTGEDITQYNVKDMASAAHVYGRPILGAEAFTAYPRNGRWLNHPFRLKPLGDRAFVLGVNRFIFHRYAAQPWLNRFPGMTMGQWGVHYDRTNTWWEQSRDWHEYLARCQYLLQQGAFVADIAYLSSERVPREWAENVFRELAPPAGYDFDILPPELLVSQLEVRDGKLVLPGGMTYRVLALPHGGTMRPALLRKIKALVADGATVVGPPPSKSPSLADLGAGDAEVRRIVGELWGDMDGATIMEHRFGKGRVYWGRPLERVLADLEVLRDFDSLDVAVGQQVRYIHRSIDGTDAYFVASAQDQATTFLCSFRAAGRKPQLWWPDSGRIERVAVYREQDGLVSLPIRLAPYGSVFVVFPPEAGAAGGNLVAVTRDGVEVTGMTATSAPDLRGKLEGIAVERAGDGKYALELNQPGSYRLKTADNRVLPVEVDALPAPVEIAGAWDVEFPSGWGAPPRATFETLCSWTARPESGIRYFSGTATYRRKIDVPAAMLKPGLKLVLDLGRVEVIAEVKLNGRDLGTLWKPPFQVDVTGVATAGANDLEIKVINLWPNRLIGDEQLPEDTERDGPMLKRWPQWLIEGKPSPSGRVTFATWKHWSKDDPLLESGLLGPVRLKAVWSGEVGREP